MASASKLCPCHRLLPSRWRKWGGRELQKCFARATEENFFGATCEKFFRHVPEGSWRMGDKKVNPAAALFARLKKSKVCIFLLSDVLASAGFKKLLNWGNKRCDTGGFVFSDIVAFFRKLFPAGKTDGLTFKAIVLSFSSWRCSSPKSSSCKGAQ